METIPREIKAYVTEDGREPFNEWIESLRDIRARAKVRVRLDRVSLGNLGDCQGVGEEVQELRVYFGREGKTIVLLLCGGDKSTQAKDIESAKRYWSEYRRRP